MLIPSSQSKVGDTLTSLSRRVNANSQLVYGHHLNFDKLIKKGEC